MKLTFSPQLFSDYVLEKGSHPIDSLLDDEIAAFDFGLCKDGVIIPQNEAYVNFCGQLSSILFSNKKRNVKLRLAEKLYNQYPTLEIQL